MNDTEMFDDLLAVSLHKDPDGRWYAVVRERCTDTGRIRTRVAMTNGGVLAFDPSGEQQLVLDEYR